jgi:hypothetical protein
MNGSLIGGERTGDLHASFCAHAYCRLMEYSLSQSLLAASAPCLLTSVDQQAWLHHSCCNPPIYSYLYSIGSATFVLQYLYCVVCGDICSPWAIPCCMNVC